MNGSGGSSVASYRPSHDVASQSPFRLTVYIATVSFLRQSTRWIGNTANTSPQTRSRYAKLEVQWLLETGAACRCFFSVCFCLVRRDNWIFFFSINSKTNWIFINNERSCLPCQLSLALQLCRFLPSATLIHYDNRQRTWFCNGHL